MFMQSVTARQFRCYDNMELRNDDENLMFTILSWVHPKHVVRLTVCVEEEEEEES
jgi:hypothetical protein